MPLNLIISRKIYKINILNIFLQNKIKIRFFQALKMFYSHFKKSGYFFGNGRQLGRTFHWRHLPCHYDMSNFIELSTISWICATSNFTGFSIVFGIGAISDL